ncbi:MAG: radical SAM protein [Vampirovibrionales bacterium]|nr:radical SAM protein [Vampirovibrionales bacterium]
MNAQNTINAQNTSLPSSVYGPVYSWRVGWSLGIDMLLETSTCSFNCIYCQLGDIQQKTNLRRVYVPTQKLQSDFLKSDWQKADIITFSGNGEPTLAENIGDVIAWLKTQCDKPIMVLTNGTQLENPAVRQALLPADIVAIKLDAGTEAGLQQMNRPVSGVSLAGILAGARLFKADYKAANPTAKLVLQCMFMPTNQAELAAMGALIGELQPDEVQLNTPKRPYPMRWTVENRGNHPATDAFCQSTGLSSADTRTLKTVDETAASHIETTLRQYSPETVITSIYRV